MTPEEQLEAMTKHEREFLESEEGDGVKNEYGVYVYKSHDERHIISLDYYLASYKSWLIENNIVKEI